MSESASQLINSLHEDSGRTDPNAAAHSLHHEDLHFNPSQEAAIHHVRGPCEILAGPGSGKTQVLIHRIRHLIRERGVDPSGILVLTFSRAAAVQMQSRYLTLLREDSKRQVSSPEDACDVTFGTFHSVFYRMYRLSTQSHPSVITASRSAELLNRLIQRHLHRLPRAGEAGEVSAMISRAKATGLFPPEGSSRSIDNFRKIYSDYEAYLEENHLFDYEDMISSCSDLLKSRPEELHKWQNQFRYLMVDEFQDVNAGQFAILRMLADTERNLCVVGDDDQSIYGFRGSDPSFMKDFMKYYPEAKQIVLDVNYRCPPDIVHASHKVILVNQNRLEKPARAAKKEAKQALFLREFVSSEDQYQWLCGTLKERSLPEQEQSAVILRTHAQMIPLMRCLEQQGVLFRENGARASSGRADPAIRQAWETVTGYYRFASELASGSIARSDLFRIMNQPERYLLRKDFRRSCYTEEELLRVYPSGSREAAALRALCRDGAALERLSPPLSLRYLIRVIGAPAGPPDLDAALAALAEGCSTSREFLRALEQTDLSKREGDPGGHGTLLLTMHAAKGLEFDTVFLPDLNEGLLPSRRSRSPEAVEEERRLFYVAMTRARNTLYLMYLRGSKLNPRLPTRFLHPLGVQDWL